MNANNLIEVTLYYPGRVDPSRVASENFGIYKMSSVFSDAAKLMEHTGGVSVPDYLDFMAATTRAAEVMAADPGAYMGVYWHDYVNGCPVDARIERVPGDLDGLVDPYNVVYDIGDTDCIADIPGWFQDLVIGLILKKGGRNDD